MELSFTGGEDIANDFRSGIQHGGIGKETSVIGVRGNELTAPTSYQCDNSGPEGHSVSMINYCQWPDPGNSDQDGSYSTFVTSQATGSAQTLRDVLDVAGWHGGLAPSTLWEEADVIYDAQEGFDRYGHYAPVDIFPGLQLEKKVSPSFHANHLGSQVNILGWLYELQYENDVPLRQYNICCLASRTGST